MALRREPNHRQIDYTQVRDCAAQSLQEAPDTHCYDAVGRGENETSQRNENRCRGDDESRSKTVQKPPNDELCWGIGEKIHAHRQTECAFGRASDLEDVFLKDARGNPRKKLVKVEKRRYQEKSQGRIPLRAAWASLRTALVT